MAKRRKKTRKKTRKPVKRKIRKPVKRKVKRKAKPARKRTTRAKPGKARKVSRKKAVKRVKRRKTTAPVPQRIQLTPRPRDRREYTPLSSSFFITSIVGFLISVLYVKKFSPTWAFAFATVFFIMFVAAVISMIRAKPVELK